MLKMNCSQVARKALLKYAQPIVFNGNDNSSGVRSNLTVKNFRITTSIGDGGGLNGLPGIIWAIVYVPTG